MYRNRKSRRGFTLLELGAVVAILATLAVLILPKVINRQASSEAAVDEMNLKQQQSALDQYHLEYGKTCRNQRTLYNAGYTHEIYCRRANKANNAYVTWTVVDGRAIAYWSDGEKPTN
jgi:prepilin-type N-terminal cleavage/methylation domain-containing protein